MHASYDKEFSAFQNGIFKPYFEKYIEFKRGKGEKVGHSMLMRLKLLNGALNRYCPMLNINREAVEIILRKNTAEQDSSWALRVSDLRQFNAFLEVLGIQAYQIPTNTLKRFIHHLNRIYFQGKN